MRARNCLNKASHSPAAAKSPIGQQFDADRVGLRVPQMTAGSTAPYRRDAAYQLALPCALDPRVAGLESAGGGSARNVRLPRLRVEGRAAVAVVISASLHAGHVSQQSASFCIVRLRVATTPAGPSAQRRREMCASSNQFSSMQAVGERTATYLRGTCATEPIADATSGQRCEMRFREGRKHSAAHTATNSAAAALRSLQLHVHTLGTFRTAAQIPPTFCAWRLGNQPKASKESHGGKRRGSTKTAKSNRRREQDEAEKCGDAAKQPERVSPLHCSRAALGGSAATSLALRVPLTVQQLPHQTEHMTRERTCCATQAASGRVGAG